MANDFLPFATDPAANVISQGAWSALSARPGGFVSGVAQSAQVNKALRQSTAMAAAIGAFVDTFSSLSAIDDGDIDALRDVLGQTIQGGAWGFAVATGTANAWIVAPALAVPAYATGRVLWIKPPANNTSTTVNADVSGLGNRRIKRSDGSNPAVGDLLGSRWYPTFDDGDQIRVIATLASDFSRVGRTQVFTASGTFVVPAGVNSVRVRVLGGGGGGGGGPNAANNYGGGGGSAGGYAEKVCAVSPGESITVTVGSGGVGGPVGSNAGAGGSSSFGSHCSSSGGSGGSYLGNAPSIGGVGTGGDVNLYGSGGQQGVKDGTTPVGAPGGGPAFGGGATSNSYAAGYVAQGYSAAGGGAGGLGNAGGAGAPGLVIVEW